MRRIILATLISVFSLTAWSQTPDLRKRIEVTGTAEAEVTPDILNISISLKEFFKDNNNRNKVEIEELERQLQTAVTKAGIPKENFTINNISSYNYPLAKKKDPGFLASKQYRIRISDLAKFNQIISAVEPRGIQSTNVDSYDYSKIETLKKELKIQALKAAKAKAAYLAQAIDENIGGALEIQEINNENFPAPVYRNYAMKADAMTEAAEMPDIDFKKIKLNYQMRVVFEIR